MSLRLFLSLGLMILPWPLRRRLLGLCFGYRIAPTARIGFSLVLIDGLEMEAGSRIGHLNIVKAFDRLVMREGSKIGDLNYVSGIGSRSRKHFGTESERRAELVLQEHSAITGRHLIDCCNRIEIGRFTTIAGARSQILTHAIDIRRSLQTSAPVVIGQYCFVGTSSVILKGAVLPDFSVLGANSTLAHAFEEPYGIYSGVPAVRVRAIDKDSAYFHRTDAYVG